MARTKVDKSLTPDVLPLSGGTVTGQLIAKGTATNDSAAAGYIGEYISSNIAFANRVSAVTTNVAFTVTSISLTAGDWDVSANYEVYAESPSAITAIQIGPTVTSNSYGVAGADGSYEDRTLSAGQQQGCWIGPRRFSLAATTTVYMNLYLTFTTVGTKPTAWGSITARRAR